MKSLYMAALLVGAGTIAAIPASATCRRSAVQFDLPAQRLDQAVQQWSRRTGCSVRTDPGLVADRPAPALRGSYTPEQALARLVSRTGYTAYATKEGFAFDRHVLDVTMSQARLLRTTLDARVRSGAIGATKAAALRAKLTGVQRRLPALVNRQGMLTKAQKSEAIGELAAVRSATGPVEDAIGWSDFQRGD